MVHSSAFHPYTRPTVTNPTAQQQELSLSEENLRFLMSADTLVALSQLPGSAKLFQLVDPPKQASPPLPASSLTPISSNSPASSFAEHPLQSPNLPNEKTRRKRTTFSPEQAAKLETEYLADSYMAREKRLLLAHSLNLSENQVKTWFQNRRAKDKRDRKTENSSNTTHSRKSSPSRKSSSESSPTPSLMTATTAFVLPPPHHIQTASSPVTIDQLSTTPPAATIIQKVDQFPSPLPQLFPQLDLLNTYLQTLATPNDLQSLLGSSPPPMFDPSMLINFQSPLESALI